MNAFAVCKVSISPLRKEAADTSEMVSQLLFGEAVTILETEGNWIKIESMFDGYVGWTDSKHLHILREKEFNRWLQSVDSIHNYSLKIISEEGQITLPRGAFLPIETTEIFNIGKHTYSLVEEIETNLSIEVLIDSYLNSPYLWGGKTPFGIDCSGFTQQVFRCLHKNLPRDAFQQYELGEEITFEERQAGDLAFFINASNKIHHVGILVSKDTIAHAHGYVRIDDFSALGITRKIDQELSHSFYGIKRM